MAKVKCDLTNCNLLENGHVSIVDGNEFSLNTASCTNLTCSKNGCTNLANCQALGQQANNHQLNALNQLNQPANTMNSMRQNESNDYRPGCSFLTDHQPNLNKNLFNRSTYSEVIKSNKFKDKKADLKFPRKTVNVIKKELSEDGKLIGSKRLTKTSLLQPSLFDNIPPTIYFGLEDELIEKPSSKDAPILIWRLSSITPQLIRETVVRSGFKLIKESSTNTKWIATWCKHLKTHQYADLNSNQKVNHFPGSFNFGRKDRLWQNINTLCIRAEETSEEDAFHPKTYILPNDVKMLKQIWTANPEMKMILKPPASARGLGIQVIHKFKQIPKESRTKQPKGVTTSAYIAQNYIENPLLLFNQTKFDIRLYVLITSFDPLRLYLYDDGLIRFASEKYSTNIEDLNNQFMHLTNYSINKKSETYKQNNDESSLDGHKWTLKTFLNYISQNPKDVCIKKLSERIVDLILKSVISCQYPVYRYLLKNQKCKYNNFELLGFDIMLDSNFKPWILEVNVSPSLRSESSVDTSVKSQLIKDTFNIVGYRLPLKYEDDLLNYTLTELEKEKHAKFADDFTTQYEKFNGDLDELCTYDFKLTENLLPDDIRHLCLAEDELSRSGSFIRLFPSKISESYLPYFAKSFYRNYLLVEWERKYGDRREEAVAYLQQLCSQKLNVMGCRGCVCREDELINSGEDSN